MAHQHRVGAVGVQLAVGFVDELVAGEFRAAAQTQGRLETHALRLDHPDRLLGRLRHFRPDPEKEKPDQPAAAVSGITEQALPPL
ncbi:hypothetical protein GCM10023089_23190 [Quisquiliibacterium transsilvanicum]